MGKTLTLIFLLNALSGEAVSAVSCDLKSICEAEKMSQEAPTRTVNGKTIRGSARTEQEDAHYEKCRRGECTFHSPERMKAIYADAVKRAKKVIQQGRPFEQLAQTEQKLIKRFDEIKLLDPSKDVPCQRACESEGTSYIPEGVCLCLETERFADETILATAAHELFHGADMCRFRETEIPMGQHPFEVGTNGGSVLACLELNDVKGRTLFEEAIFTKNTAYQISKVSPDSGIILPWIGAYFIGTQVLPDFKSPHCRRHLGYSQMVEGAADLLGYQVLGDFLKEYPLKKGDLSNFSRVFGPILDKACNKSRFLTVEGDTHSDEETRIRKIALSIPSLREALGCPSQGLSCDYRPNRPRTEGASGISR